MYTTTLTNDRKEIIKQFPIKDRDGRVYEEIEEAVEDALRRSFKDINFRTMTAKNDNKSIKEILEKINGPRKIKKFNIETVEDQKKKELIEKLIEKIEKFEGNVLSYNDCSITEYLIVRLIDEGFIKRFVDYFNSTTFMSESEFDGWHHDAADMFLNVLRDYYDKAYYGKAQKIVNMMFKHLYCMNFGEKNDWKVLCEKYFKHCHMPLDSFTLDWLSRKAEKATCEWSNLEYGSTTGSSEKQITSYVDCVDRVRKLFPLNGLTAFQGEFYIWPQMQITQALETIYRLNNHSKDEFKEFVGYDIKKKCSIIVDEIGEKRFAKIFV